MRWLLVCHLWCQREDGIFVCFLLHLNTFCCVSGIVCGRKYDLGRQWLGLWGFTLAAFPTCATCHLHWQPVLHSDLPDTLLVSGGCQSRPFRFHRCIWPFTCNSIISSWEVNLVKIRDISERIRLYSIHTAAPSTHPLVAWTALLWFFFRFLRSFLKCSKQNCTGYSSCSLVLNKRRMFVSLVFFILLCGIQDFVSWTGCSSLQGQIFKRIV